MAFEVYESFTRKRSFFCSGRAHMLMSTMPKIEPLLVVITDHDSNRKHITLCLFSRQALPIYRGHLNM